MEFLKNIPLLITRGYIAIPNNNMMIDVGRKDSIDSVNNSLNNYNGHIFITSQIDPKKEKIEPSVEEKKSTIFDIGSYALITKKEVITDQIFRIHVKVINRGKINKIISSKDNENNLIHHNVDIRIINTIYEDNDNYEHVLFRKIIKLFDKFLILGGTKYLSSLNIGKEFLIKDYTPETFTDMMSYVLPLTMDRQQLYLNTISLKDRLTLLLEDLTLEIEYLKIDGKIESSVREYFDNTQREYYLKEKLRVIKEELGDKNIKDKEIDSLKSNLKKLKAPKAIKEKLSEEIERYESVHQSSAESHVIKSYIDWLFAIPWNVFSPETYDLSKAKRILDKHHYGLREVKNRILEFLAVKKLSNNCNTNIICLVGPPGVGKTSIAQSIAEVTNKSYVKISLGGVHDEAEIRGHRRTYIGAMPGKIIQALKKAKTMNPLILLDEIDKIANDIKGDPVSALLEVLDPQQNTKFIDHYIEEEVDLSKVMFITTANYFEGIPEPLYDRMEIIEIGSYTEEEKLKIAQDFIIPKKYKETCIRKDQLFLPEEVLKIIIKKYAREAGVRGLERQISKIFRKVAKKIVEGFDKKIILSRKNLHVYLGKPLYTFNKVEKDNQVGVVSGLAYTNFGGDILPVEVVIYPGNDRLVLTGKLGEVMKESANIALSWVKSQAVKYKLSKDFFEKNTIHIHFPEGAVPKDGPSAGITIASAIISAITKKKVERTIGLTGEITLRGNVLPIGGLKEKAMAAYRSGLKTIIIPADNKKDINEIPKSVKSEMKILSVKSITEVLPIIMNC